MNYPRISAFLLPVAAFGLLALTGCGAGAGDELTLAPAMLDFGTVDVGESEQVDLRIFNGGRKDALLTGIDISGSGFDHSLPLPYVLLSDQESSLPFMFAPTESGDYSETLTLTFESGSVQSVPLLGVGLGEGAGTPTPDETPTETPAGTPLPGDLDGDGYNPLMGDCNEDDANIHPGADDLCGDGIDQDCSGVADDADADGDGFQGCATGNDCDDTDGTIYPGAAEVCDGFDEDCDGLVDEGFDADGDGVTECAGDCDDNNPSVAPGFVDGCLPGDNDCDTLVDEDAPVDENGDPDCSSGCPVYVEASDIPVIETTGDALNPFPTIGAGIQNRGECDTIYVLPGSYAESIVLPATDITLVAPNGADQTVITGNESAPVVRYDAGQTSESVLEGFTLTGSSEPFGSCLHIGNASPTIRGNTFSECNAAGGGGAVYVNEGAPNFKNNTFSNNQAPQGGGVMLDGSGTTATFSENVFSGNRATNGEGGAIFVNKAADVVFSDNVFSGNNASGVEDTQAGGALAANEASNLTFSNNLFEANEARDGRNGGAIHLFGVSGAEFAGDIFQGNTAEGGGAGVNIEGGTNITLNGVEFIENVASRDGGGVRCDGADPLQVNDALFKGNSAGNGGGVAAANACTARIFGAILVENTADLGAAIYYGVGSPGEVRNGYLARNTAAVNGGGIYLNNASPKIRNNIILDNTAIQGSGLSGQGGGIYIVLGAPDIINNVIVGNNAMGGGGGIVWSLFSTGVTLQSNIIAFNITSGDHGGVESYANPAAFDHNNVFGNEGGDFGGFYSDSENPTGSGGNISVDPFFTLFEAGGSFVANDYTLGTGSPCIDTGIDDEDFNDSDETRNDMGAFGGSKGEWTAPDVSGYLTGTN